MNQEAMVTTYPTSGWWRPQPNVTLNAHQLPFSCGTYLPYAVLSGLDNKSDNYNINRGNAYRYGQFLDGYASFGHVYDPRYNHHHLRPTDAECGGMCYGLNHVRKW